MNIAVCLKQTFDTEEKISIENGKVSATDVELIINPYDEYAIEEAIQLKDTHGGEVTVITIGTDQAESAVRTALAMGADKGIIIQDDYFQDKDEYILSKALAKVIKNGEYDLILAGNFSVDNGAGQVAIRLAEELDIAHIGSVTKLQVEGTKVTAERDVEGDTEMIESSLPILITAQQGLNEPRYPSLPGIMKAKKKPIEYLNASQIDWDNTIHSETTTIEEFLPPQKGAGKILEGDIATQVRELVETLQKQHKII